MIKVLLVGPQTAIQDDISQFLGQVEAMQISKALTKWKALDLMAQQRFDLAIIDEFVGGQTGIELAEKLIPIDPMMNCVLISPLAEGQFHEATEGLGILAQLSEQPTADDIFQIVEKLKEIHFQSH